MPPKIYFSDEEKRKDELKQKQRGKPVALKVVKSSAAKNSGPKTTNAAVRRVRGARGVKAEGSTASSKSVPMDTSSDSVGNRIQSGRVTIGKSVRSLRLANKPIPTVTITNKKALASASNNRRGNAAAAAASPATSKRGSAASTPRSPSAGKTGGRNKPQTPLQKSIETARSVVANPRHPKHNDVKTLLESHQKKFVTDERFIELLKNLLF